MASIKWEDGTESDILTTDLNSLGNNARAISGVIDNDANLNLYADFQLEVQYDTAAPSAGTRIADLYLLPTVDGTNYPEGSASLTPQQSLHVGSFESRNPSISAIERLVLAGVALPPRDFKVLIVNVSGVTWETTGNVLSIRPYRLQVV